MAEIKATDGRRLLLSVLNALLDESLAQLVNQLMNSEVMQELPHNVRKATRIVLMDYVPAVKRNETSIGPSRCHLLEVVLRRNPALPPTDQESRAFSREPVGPMVTIELKL